MQIAVLNRPGRFVCGLRRLAVESVLSIVSSSPLAPLMASASEPASAPAPNTAGGQPPLSGEVSRTARGHHALSGATSEVLHRKLENTPLLLSPKEDQLVETPYGNVYVAVGSVALIVPLAQGLAVYNLHDTRKAAVVINRPEGNIEISPERAAVLIKSTVTSFQEANPAPFVAYRRVTCNERGADMKLYQADFEFMSMARGLPKLKELMESKDQETHKSMGGMLKTAAVMMQISQSSEPYGYYITQRVRDISAAAKP